MKPLPWLAVERYRWASAPGWESAYGDDFGVFQIPSPVSGQMLRVLVSAANTDAGLAPWDHVSVSLPNRCPNWPEMESIKRLFFRDDEAAMQLHPPLSDYRSHHPYCLHIWRPADIEIPLPPGIMVAEKALA